ncbi:hypothetical protein UFOVP691_44 [uncultured Caudovirales phage]|uniref:Uncharacterized protein n=1 Tax=uncultured Caudovirales phage TaxID=2100421 RepID=A0A6J5NGC1_9CAUD|nr:hypothetical protein UFOVP691_44 [uncultured Caudovirales phage]
MPICNDGAGTRKQARTEKPVTINDLLNAIYFLRKTHVGQMDVDRLVQTVQALEAEIEKRRKKK